MLTYENKIEKDQYKRIFENLDKLEYTQGIL